MTATDNATCASVLLKSRRRHVADCAHTANPGITLQEGCRRRSVQASEIMHDSKLQHGPKPGFRIVPVAQVNLPGMPAVGENWQALHALIAEGFTIFELLHDHGMRAEWYFNAAGQQSNTMEPWSDDTRAALRAAFRPAVAALCDTLLPTYPVRLHPTQTAALHEFLRLGPGLRDAVISALAAELLPEPTHSDIDVPGAAPPSWVDPAALRQALSVDLQDRFVDAMQTGTLTWPSPADGTDMPCTGAFTLDDFNGLLRFADPSSGLDAFVLATEHVSRVAGLYVPGRGMVFSLGSDQTRMLKQHFRSLSRGLIQHLSFYAESLLAGRAHDKNIPRFATFLRGGGSAHLFHQLWNELTAIDTLLAKLPQDRLPTWLIPGMPGQEIEFYGPIDSLFPEISSQVRRGFADHAALVRHAYENRLILFRATGERISEGLRRRIVAYAASRVSLPLDASRSFVIGLRVENRTATDLGALCALMIEEAVRLHPGCTIVFDGHNARGDTRSDETFSSHREAVASQSPLAAERAIVEAMRQRFADQPVTLLDTLGEPLAVSLAWSQACDGFVALWGAGLTKYRLVANKPGLTMTNRWNLRNKGDLHLYDSAAYVTDPTPLVFVPSTVIQDLPSAPMLVPFEHPSYSNFTFEPDAMRNHICAFLAALDGPPDALAALAIPPQWRQGNVETVGTTIRGWAACSGQSPAMLDIVIDGAVVGRAACDMPRRDLLAAGVGVAKAGFEFPIPPAFLDGAPRLLTVRYSDGVSLPMLSPNTPDPFAFRLGAAPPAPG